MNNTAAGLTQLIAAIAASRGITSLDSGRPPAIVRAWGIGGGRRTQGRIGVHRIPPEPIATAPLLMEFIIADTRLSLAPV